MFDPTDTIEERDEERLFSWRRVKTLVVGSIAVVVACALPVSVYTYSRYGGTPFDELLGRRAQFSAAASKLAYSKGTDLYLGVIKGEGKKPRLGKVFYIEQAGGQVIEVAQERVEVRQRRGASRSRKCVKELGWPRMVSRQVQ
jgi:hypothetical protein